jgi:hypothetical protein
MALLKRGRGGTSNQLQIAAQGRYRLEGNGAKLERVVGMKTGEAPTSLTIPHGDHLSGLRSEGCAPISREAQFLKCPASIDENAQPTAACGSCQTTEALTPN